MNYLRTNQLNIRKQSILDFRPKGFQRKQAKFVKTAQYWTISTVFSTVVENLGENPKDTFTSLP